MSDKELAVRLQFIGLLIFTAKDKVTRCEALVYLNDVITGKISLLTLETLALSLPCEGPFDQACRTNWMARLNEVFKGI